MTNNPKKRLLFVIESLSTGGAEKSLVTLLNLIDYSKYEVDLQLFAYDGKLMEFIPKEVNLLPHLGYTQFLSQPLWKQWLEPRKLKARLSYSHGLRKNRLKNPEIACLYWQKIGPVIENSSKKYDAAIAYSQGIPTFYVVDKINAEKKFGWVNVLYYIEASTKSFIRPYYEALHHIVAVSDQARDFFLSDIFPDQKDKFSVIRDILDPDFIRKLALQPGKILRTEASPTIIVTTGRVNNRQKGFDYIVPVAKRLQQKGLDFRWFVVGDGPYRPEMEKLITDSGMDGHIVLLGATSNPYRYMKQCDIYVQPSRYEGFGLTIAEARILNRPVVTTNYTGHEIQMKHEQNGLVSTFNPEDIADAIIRLVNDRELYRHIQEFQRTEKIDNREEIEKLYALLEE